MIKIVTLITLLFVSLYAKEIFPFIAETKGSNFTPTTNRGMFLNFEKSKEIVHISKVNFAKLDSKVKIIYITPINIKQFFYSTNDLFLNIMASYNLGDEEKEKLDSWIAGGGILWLEAGFFATGKEIYSLEKSLNKQSILMAAEEKSKNESFLDFQVKNVYFTLSEEQMQDVAVMSVKLTNLQSNKELNGIKSLKIDLHYFTQTYFLLDGKSLLKDAEGRELVTINTYGRGKIISLFPYEYRNPSFDGEKFRWKMMSYLNLDKSYFVAKKYVQPAKIKKVKTIEKSSTKGKVIEGYCIQLFAMQNLKIAQQEIKESSNLDVNRLEKRGKYYVGRTGIFKTSKEAKPQLKLAHKKFKEAFVRKCDYSVDNEIVY